jgi:hypothetical protein
VPLFDQPRPRVGLGREHGAFGGGDRRGRERRDAAREPRHEGAQLVRRERTVQVAEALGALGVEVIAAEDHLERTAAADKARQPLGVAAAGQDAGRPRAG